MSSLHTFSARSIDGQDVDLSAHAGKDGRVIGRYPPTTEPVKIRGDIEKAIGG